MAARNKNPMPVTIKKIVSETPPDCGRTFGRADGLAVAGRMVATATGVLVASAWAIAVAFGVVFGVALGLAVAVLVRWAMAVAVGIGDGLALIAVPEAVAVVGVAAAVRLAAMIGVLRSCGDKVVLLRKFYAASVLLEVVRFAIRRENDNAGTVICGHGHRR